MLDQIMNTLRHTSTDPTSGHAVSQIRGRLRMFQRQMSNYAKRTVSKIRHTTPLVSEDQIFARTRELQVEAIHHVIGRLIDEMGRIRTTPSIVRHCCWIIVVPRLHCRHVRP